MSGGLRLSFVAKQTLRYHLGSAGSAPRLPYGRYRGLVTYLLQNDHSR